MSSAASCTRRFYFTPDYSQLCAIWLETKPKYPATKSMPFENANNEKPKGKLQQSNVENTKTDLDAFRPVPARRLNNQNDWNYLPNFGSLLSLNRIFVCSSDVTEITAILSKWRYDRIGSL